MELYGIDSLGITSPKAVYRNLDPEALTQMALDRGEGELCSTGALVITTGAYTGRSPKDKFIVDTPAVHDNIAWGDVNVPISREKYEAIKQLAVDYLNEREVFIFDGFAGAMPKYQKRFRVLNELAAQNLFIHDLLIRPTAEELAAWDEQTAAGNMADYVIYAAPGCKLDAEKYGVHSEAAVIIDYEACEIVIVGTGYCGEIKKSIFSTMNYIMPLEGVLPMHCSANMDPVTKDTAVFFGLSGTGKTTLSTDPNRAFIGDDEHGWCDEGIFNFEGGCYAKCIDLTEEREPEIFNAIKAGAVVENVIMDPVTKVLDFADSTLTENTRVGYPVDYVPNAVEPSVGGIPKVVLFLTADAFGVLPPISRLSREAAMYHFITGFTSKVAGTERGITEPVPTFSTLFGEPFMPMNASVYAEMLGERIDKAGTQVYLINTGWAGGTASSGAKRMKLSYTRQMVTAALTGALEDAEYVHHDVFNVDMPTHVEGCPDEILNPRGYWIAQGKTGEEYDETAARLAKMFEENFSKRYPDVDPKIAAAGPHA